MINIIIIGAKNNIDYTYKNNNVLTYNNPFQANHLTLVELINHYKDINIYNYDIYEYYDDYIYNTTNIFYFSDLYKLGDTTFINKNGSHNIIIEFCNILNENYVSNCFLQGEKMLKYIDCNLTWITCGCMWSDGFPINLIKYIIDNKYYTPVIYNSPQSFLDAISNTQKIINENKQDLMKPYSQGVYQILGTLFWRGNKTNDYQNENVLYELFNIIDYKFSNDEYQKNFNKFLNKEIHWNSLNYNIRKELTYYIYGNNITIDT